MKNRGMLITILVVAAAGTAAYFIYKSLKKKKIAEANGMTVEEYENALENNNRIENGEIAGPPQFFVKRMTTQAQAYRNFNEQ